MTSRTYENRVEEHWSIESRREWNLGGKIIWDTSFESLKKRQEEDTKMDLRKPEHEK
jgi:hypothetical protein